MSMLATFKTDLLPILKQGSDREIDPSLINDMELCVNMRGSCIPYVRWCN